MRRFQHFFQLGDAASYILSHTETEVYNAGREVIKYFEDAEEQILNTEDNFNEANEDLDTSL